MNLQLAPSPIDEASAVSAGSASAHVARLGDEAAVLDAIEARRVQLGLSNATLERLSGLCIGHVTKIAGPSREKSPTLTTLDRVMAVLGLSFVLVLDPSKIERAQSMWRHRAEAKVRHRALSPTTIARARPHVMARLAKRAAHPRWANVPARAFVQAMMSEGNT
jgi:hypothetical protein